MPHRELALKIQHFHHDEDIGFHISSRMEMVYILQDIAKQRTQAVLYYGKGRSFILTMLLGADDDGIWLDVGPSFLKNKQLLASGEITFVGVHQHVKVQFVAHHIEFGMFENKEAFHMALPDYLLRIQRREFFRIHIPLTAEVKFIIPIHPENPADPVIMRNVPVMDISGGGIGMICEKDEEALLPNKVFGGCQILLPDSSMLSTSVDVRYSIDHSTPGNTLSKRVGCRFLHLDSQANIMLQRLITQLQSESMVAYG